MGAKKTVPEFRQALSADMKARKIIEERKARENELLETFLKQAKFDVPPILIEEEVDFMMEDFKRQIEQRGLKFDTYMKKMEEEKRDVRSEFVPESEKRVRVRLILHYLFKTFSIDITDAEVDEAAKRLLEATPESQRQKISQQLEQRGEIQGRLKNNLMLEKLFAKFLD